MESQKIEYLEEVGSSDPRRRKGVLEKSRAQRFFGTNLRKELCGLERTLNLVLKATVAFKVS